MSLRHLVLRDFVIVQSLELDFSQGFTALTGETGAGKSILIDALQLVLGGRADAGVVREACAKAEISAAFDLNAELRAWLDAEGFDPEGDELLLRRTIDAQGKSRGWIQGSAATAAQLRSLGDLVLDIHGQHAWQSLTRTEAVRDLLDAYAGIDRAPLQQAWSHWREAVQTLEHARTAQDSLQQERERLQWQIGEVEKLAPQADEWEGLNQQHKRLANAQALLEAAQLALNALEGEDDGVLRQLHRAQGELQAQSAVEPQFAAWAEVLASAVAQSADVAHELQAYLSRTELDPEGLQALDERLALWVSLARRYKRAPEDLPALLQDWRTRLAQLDAAVDLAGLEASEARAQEAYQAEAKRVSQARKKSAPKLSQAITTAMQDLGMQGGRFEVALEPVAPAAYGLEQAQFLVAGHAGSTPRPVAKVASGGELSRIALAIAVTTSTLGTAGTLIFDEVDAGVGGAVAETVGRLMQQLGRDRQVLAVTHLPQVAACPDHHLVVRKQRSGTQTLSEVTPVEGEARVTEIARMLGGEKRTETSLAHAREMLTPPPEAKRARKERA